MTTRQHISAQFAAELEAIRSAVMEMGGQVERQIVLASEGLENRDSGLAEQAIAIDRDINRMEVEIDEQCAVILARRQPAAGDLRLIISIIKLTTDLERIGDEASRVSRLVIKLASKAGSDPIYQHTARVARHVSGMLRQALDAFARMSASAAVRVVLSDKEIDHDYREGLAKLTAGMRAAPDEVESFVDHMWALRSLERIGDHATNIAEHVVYLARGVDIRHLGEDGLESMLK
jgi:phosphate transport system protein